MSDCPESDALELSTNSAGSNGIVDSSQKQCIAIQCLVRYAMLYVLAMSAVVQPRCHGYSLTGRADHHKGFMQRVVVFIIVTIIIVASILATSIGVSQRKDILAVFQVRRNQNQSRKCQSPSASSAETFPWSCFGSRMHQWHPSP